MKKLFLAFSFFFLSVGNVFAAEPAGFSLDNALEALDVTPRPQYLAGIDGEFAGDKLKGDASDLTRFIEKVAKSLAGAAAAIAIVMIVMNALSLVTAVGDSDAIGNAKKGLLWSFAGLLLIIFAYVIIKSIIAITYSGEIQEQAEEPVVEVQQCERPVLVDNIPPATYGEGDSTDLNAVQHKTGDEDFPSSLYAYGLGGTGKAVQNALKDGGHYEDLPTRCQEPDGFYGECTMRALQNYNEAQTEKLAECEKKAKAEVPS